MKEKVVLKYADLFSCLLYIYLLGSPSPNNKWSNKLLIVFQLGWYHQECADWVFVNLGDNWSFHNTLIVLRFSISRAIRRLWTMSEKSVQFSVNLAEVNLTCSSSVQSQCCMKLASHWWRVIT